MMRLMVFAIVTLLAALGAGGWRLSVIEARLDKAQHKAAALAADLSNREKAIDQLNRDSQASRKREAELRLQQNQASAQALNRETTIRRETDANPALRAWSATALPADVIRLHSRPAFSNARDYLDWLSTRDQLPHPGEPPANTG